MQTYIHTYTQIHTNTTNRRRNHIANRRAEYRAVQEGRLKASSLLLWAQRCRMERAYEAAHLAVMVRLADYLATK